MEVQINIEPRDRKELSSNCNCQDQTNRFKGLDLIECLKIYGWRFVICIGGGDQNHSPQNKCKNANWLSEEILQMAEERREVKGKGEI